MRFSIMLGAHPFICSLGSSGAGGRGAWGHGPVRAVGAGELGCWPWLLNKDVVERKVLH